MSRRPTLFGFRRWLSVCLLTLGLVVTAHGQDASLGPFQTQMQSMVRDLKQRVLDKKLQKPEEFSKVCDEMAQLLRDATSRSSSLADTKENAQKLRTGTREAIRTRLETLLSGNESALDAWLVAHSDFLGKLKQIAGTSYDENKVADLIRVYRDGAIVLETASRDAATSVAAGGSLTSDLSRSNEFIYARLKELGVEFDDDSFPDTCRAVAKAMEDVIAAADSETPPPTGTAFREKCNTAIEQAYRSTTKGDDLAITAWGKAHTDMKKKLDAIMAKESPNADDYKVWRSAYQVVIAGLKHAAGEDDIINKQTRANGSRYARSSGGTTSTTTRTVTSTTHAAVWHERMMAHMVRKNERRMYKIQSIRGY